MYLAKMYVNFRLQLQSHYCYLLLLFNICYSYLSLFLYIFDFLFWGNFLKTALLVKGRCYDCPDQVRLQETTTLQIISQPQQRRRDLGV
jgi:hypothetical protein